MERPRTFFGRYYDHALHKTGHEVLVTIALPIASVGPFLARLSADAAPPAAIPVALAIGPVADALCTLLETGKA